jgi:hypothetical protein
LNTRPNINITAVLAIILALGSSCAQDSPYPAGPAVDEAQPWVHEHAQVSGQTPAGWLLIQADTDAWHFSRNDAPGHILTIQRLTTNTGRSPLKILRQSIKNHLYFTDFKYESKWERRVDSVWAPAFHATYFYLNKPAVRYGLLLPTPNGYYEISYHAPTRPLAEGVTGYEQLVDSITMFVDD